MNNVLFLFAGEAPKNWYIEFYKLYMAHMPLVKRQTIATWRLLEYHHCSTINHKGLGFTEDIVSEDFISSKRTGGGAKGGGSARQVNNKAKNGQKRGRAAAGEAKKGYQTYYY